VTLHCPPAVTGPCNTVKQLPSCTIKALWAKPVGGRRLADRAPGVAETNASCSAHTLRPSGRAITRGVSKPTMSPTSPLMNWLSPAVSVPAAHSVVTSAWAVPAGDVMKPTAPAAASANQARLAHIGGRLRNAAGRCASRRLGFDDVNDPVRLALVGLGRMGRVHAAALTAIDGIDVVAVADPSDEARAAAVSLFPKACVLREPEEAFALSGVEACLLATPTPLHPQHVRAALDNGLHVLCEKPLSLDPAVSPDIHQQAVDRGRVLQLGFWRRYAAPWRAAKSALDDGRIGAPLYIRLSQWDADPPPASFCDPNVSGGLAIDCGVHEYDLAEWFSGQRVVRVHAHAAPIVDQSLAAVGDVDNLVAVLELDGGAVATVDLSRNCRYGDDVRTEILGSQGALLIDLLPSGRVRLGTADGMVDLDGVAVGDVTADGVANQAAAFAAAIRGTGEPGPGALASAQATLIGHAVQQSIRTSTAVDVEAIG
jgi:predicted dehydrogenase